MIEAFFRWCESSLIGRAVAESIWAFPILEAVHLIGLCMLGGALLVVDLRLLGVGLTGQPVAALARHARPWLIGALVTMVATGVPLFLSEAIKAYYNTSFWVKMSTLPVALAFTFTVRERIVRRDRTSTGCPPEGRPEGRPEGPEDPQDSGDEPGAALDRIVGAVSLTLWFIVAAAGRWIGFS